jgi:endonuclease/exonuclease/phosphatase family metal-dependent hydrolase
MVMSGKKIVKWVMMISNIIAVIFMLITLIGSVLSPAKVLFPAYFSLIFPFILVINIAFVVFWLVTRKWNFLLSLGVLIFSATLINNNFPVHFGKSDPLKPVNSIHLLTYNTMMSGSLVKDTPRKHNKVMQYVVESNADIVCLQEFVVSTQNEFLNYSDILRIYRKYPYKHVEFKGNWDNKLFGIATFSKYPIVNKQLIEYPSQANISIYTDINVNGTIIRLFNNHLESNKFTESDISKPIRLKNKFDADSLAEMTHYFSHKLGVTYKLRAYQADTVAKLIAESPYKVIVCGDFNDVPASYAYTKMKGKLKDAFSESGNGFGWTYKEPFYGFRIDYVLYDSNAFTLIKYESDKVNYSDHYPVLCQLSINKNNSN